MTDILYLDRLPPISNREIIDVMYLNTFTTIMDKLSLVPVEDAFYART